MNNTQSEAEDDDDGPPIELSHALEEDEKNNEEELELLLAAITLETQDTPRPLYGSWQDLLSYLVIPFNADLDFRDAFLLTVSDFGSPELLAKGLSLEMICDNVGKRVHSLDQKDLGVFSKEDLKTFVGRKEWILDIFRVWLQRHPLDFSDDVIEVVRTFTNNFHPHWDSAVLATSARLQQVFDRLEEMLVDASKKRKDEQVSTRGKTRRASITSLNFIKKFTDMSTKTSILDMKLRPKDVAKQLTRMQSEKFREIRSRELLAMQYLRGSAQNVHWKAAPTVLSYITFHNKISLWIVEEMNSFKKVEQCIEACIYFLRIAKVCMKYGNFETAFAIIGGLHSKLIRMRAKILKELPPDGMNLWREAESIMEPGYNHRGYREQYEILETTDCPRIPFIGIVIGALRGLRPRWETDEMSVIAQSKKEIDFSRRLGLFHIIKDVELAQQTTIDFSDNNDDVYNSDDGSYNSDVSSEKKRSFSSLLSKRKSNDSDDHDEHRIYVALDRAISIVEIHDDNTQIYHGFSDALLLSSPRVLSGKPKYLINYLLLSYGRDVEFREAFFMCFEDFLQCSDLLQYLLDELNKTPLKNAQNVSRKVNTLEEQQHELTEDKLAILKCIQHWMWDYPIDFETSVVEKLHTITPKSTWKNIIGAALYSRLEKAYEDFHASLSVVDNRRIQAIRSKTMQRRLSGGTTPKFVAKMVERGPTLELLKMKKQDIAQQLTLIQLELFLKIPLRELTQCRWMSKNKWQLAPGILSYIAHHNKISMWVGQEILSHQSSEERTVVLHLFIDVCKHCVKIGNYDTAFAILGGLSSGPVFRLKYTWKRVEPSYAKRYESLLKLTSTLNNYRIYRQSIEHLLGGRKPHIMFLGVTLSDLVKVQHLAQQHSHVSLATIHTTVTANSNGSNDASNNSGSDTSESTTMGIKKFVDFNEYLSVYHIIQRVKTSQQSVFPFVADLQIQMVLRECVMKAVIDNQEKLFEYSLRAEPRDSKHRQYHELLHIMETAGL